MQRTSFSGSIGDSGLVRVLADLEARHAHALPGPSASAGPARGGLAERLSGWLDWTQAVPIAAALGDGHRGAEGPPGLALAAVDGRAVQGARRAVDAVRRERAAAIDQDALLAGGPAPRPTAAEDVVPDFAPYRRRYAQHQQAMAAAIAPLRLQVRAALAGVSPDGQRLAALDAVWAGVLAVREGALLATLPGRVERLFLQSSTPTAAALAGFGRDLQALLQAELATRLQPVEGLLAALAVADQA